MGLERKNMLRWQEQDMKIVKDYNPGEYGLCCLEKDCTHYKMIDGEMIVPNAIVYNDHFYGKSTYCLDCLNNI